jgi:hypothetical protein
MLGDWIMQMLLLGFQVMLMGIGLWWMIAKRLNYAGYEILTPANFFMGALLFFQLPMCFFIGTSAGAAEAIRAIVSGHQTVDGKKLQQKYWWIDPTVTGGAVVLAAGIALFSVRPEKSKLRPHEAPVGVRDYVFDYKQQEAQESRWNRPDNDYDDHEYDDDRDDR